MPDRESSGRARAPLAVAALALVAAAVLAIHLSCLTRYGWFRDELYYLSCAKRLAWGYVDHPPLSIAILAALRAIAGDSLAVARLAAVAAGTLLVFLSGALAREMGGGRWAQVVAAAALGVAPIVLSATHTYSMNAFDLVFWALATLLALRAFARGGARAWLALGVALGLGLLGKWSVAWLGAGLAVALVASPARRQLLTPWPYLAALLAGAIVAPNLVWETRNGWPTLEFMRNASTHKMQPLDLAGLLGAQLLVLGPGAAAIWVAGFVVALRRSAWRPLAIVWLVTLALLVANGSARAGYLALAALPLFAAGAVWWEERGRVARGAVALVSIALSLPLAPFALPVLPVEQFVAYQQALGRAPKSEERHAMGPLPQHYADMFGWPGLADSVARVTASLASEERAGAIVRVGNYGEAGAIELFGAGRVPTVSSGHNNWAYWNAEWDGRVLILVGEDSSDVATLFESVEVAAYADHPLAMPYERHLPILVARGFRGDARAALAQGRHFE